MLKTKIQPSKSEDLIGFIGHLVNQAVSLLANGRAFEGLYKIEDFYRKKNGTRELLAKQKKGVLFCFVIRPAYLLLEGKRRARVLSCRLAHLPLRHGEDPWERLPQCWSIYFWLGIKIILLVKVETIFRLGVKSWFDIIGFSTNDAIWGLGFSL